MAANSEKNPNAGGNRVEEAAAVGLDMIVTRDRSVMAAPSSTASGTASFFSAAHDIVLGQVIPSSSTTSKEVEKKTAEEQDEAAQDVISDHITLSPSTNASTTTAPVTFALDQLSSYTSDFSFVSTSKVSNLLIDQLTLSLSSFSFSLPPTSAISAFQPLDTFTCFPKLPVELRLKIWQEIDGQEPHEIDLGSNGGLYGARKHGPLCFINQESQEEFQRLYPPLGFIVDNRYKVKVPFSSDLGTIHFVQLDWMTVVRDLCRVEYNRKQLAKIKRVAFESVHFRSNVKMAMKQQYCALPNLVEVTLYLSSFYEDHSLMRELSDDDIAALPQRVKGFVNLHKEVIGEGLDEGVWKGKRQPEIRVLSVQLTRGA